jgi:hypothetical protein
MKRIIKRDKSYLQMFFILICLALLFACNGVSPTETLPLQPKKDAEVSIKSPDANFGHSSSLYVGYDSLTDPRYRAYLYFDVNSSSLPADAVVTSAYLYLHQYYFYGTGGLSIGLYQVTSDWEEGKITWNDQPDSLPKAEYTLYVYFTTGTWRTWMIGDLVKGWLDGSIANYGILLKPVDEASNDKIAYFYSSDSSNTPRLPKLVIEYDVP